MGAGISLSLNPFEAFIFFNSLSLSSLATNSSLNVFKEKKASFCALIKTNADFSLLSASFGKNLIAIKKSAGIEFGETYGHPKFLSFVQILKLMGY